MAPPMSITVGASSLGLGASSSMRIVQQMDRGEGGDDDGDEHARAHPELADGQTAEHRGQRERHPVRRADQPVRAITAFLRHQEGDRRRERDRSQVARDRAAEDERDERPERGAG